MEEGPSVETVELFGLIQKTPHDVSVVEALLKAKANPCYVFSQYARIPTSCVTEALIYEDTDLLRLYCSYCGTDFVVIDQFDGDIRPPLEYAIHCRSNSSLVCLLELGLPYKHTNLWYDIPPGEILPRQIEERALTAAIYGRFIAREDAARRACAALLSARWRTRVGVPRDVARLLAVEVWRTQRREVWEPKEMLEDWNRRQQVVEEAFK